MTTSPPRRALSHATVTLLLGNGQALLRDGLRRQFEGHAQLSVVGEASSAAEILSRAEELQPDMVLLDDADGPASTAALVSALRERQAGLGIVVMSAREAIRPALDLVRAGASALLSRDDRLEDLERALAAVRRGESFVSARLAWSSGGENARLDVSAGPDALSGRERELLQHVADGATLREASRRMAISESTASTYRSRMLKKLALKNTAQLIRFAVDHGIYGPPQGRNGTPRTEAARPSPED